MVRLLFFNPRLWELISINPFDFGFNNFSVSSKIKEEFEEVLSILQKNVNVIELCSIISYSTLRDLVMKEIKVEYEEKIDKDYIINHIINEDKETLCKLIILNPIIFFHGNQKVRIFSEKILGDLLWLRKFTFSDKEKIAIGHPSIYVPKIEILLLYEALKEIINKEPLKIEYPPSIIDFRDVVTTQNILLAEIGQRTNVEGVTSLFEFKYSILGEIYSPYITLPLSKSLRFLNDYLISNKNFLENSDLHIYVLNEKGEYVFKRKDNLYNFLVNENKMRLIDINQGEITKGILSFLVIGKRLIIKETDNNLIKNLENLGYEILTVKSKYLFTDQNGPYDLFLPIYD
ncbi:MAG: hypothetical protein RXQ80_02730 [Sulfolobaceae archaeon]